MVNGRIVYFLPVFETILTIKCSKLIKDWLPKALNIQ